jgi:hypothetical protein
MISSSPPSGRTSQNLSLSLILSVTRWTLGGCALAFGLVYFIFHKTDLSLGLFAGGILSTLYLISLGWMSGKILASGFQKGGGQIWFWNLFRWLSLAFACWGLLQISTLCLLGALAGYIWFLAVLAWIGKKTGQHLSSNKA